jgi:hypothetical protein
MSFIINNQEIFQTTLYTILIRGISIIFIDQIPNYLVFKQGTFCAGIKIFNSLSPSVAILQNDMAKCEAALRKYLHTHCFYFVDEFVKCL